MEMNTVVLCGKLAKPPEIRTFDSGSRLVRSLITVRTDTPRRRVDVIPVTLWDPASDHELMSAEVGTTLWATGSVQRRFWTSSEGRESVLEIIAQHIEVYPREDLEPAADSGTGDVD